MVNGIRRPEGVRSSIRLNTPPSGPPPRDPGEVGGYGRRGTAALRQSLPVSMKGGSGASRKTQERRATWLQKGGAGGIPRPTANAKGGGMGEVENLFLNVGGE